MRRATVMVLAGRVCPCDKVAFVEDSPAREAPTGVVSGTLSRESHGPESGWPGKLESESGARFREGWSEAGGPANGAIAQASAGGLVETWRIEEGSQPRMHRL